jgi:hypothetical protein
MFGVDPIPRFTMRWAQLCKFSQVYRAKSNIQQEEDFFSAASWTYI